MIIEKKNITLEKIESGDHCLYNEMSLIADKLRACYNLFGWSHMLKNFEEADETVETLTMDCIKEFYKTGSRVTMGTVGLIVDVRDECEDHLTIDYSFNIG